MKKQPDINDSMRAILVDWLVEVSEEYRLQSETLCLAVNYIDRFLSFMSVVRAKLQLVGTAAMFIASKYEEIYPPEITEFVYITDDTYTKQQVLRMEKLLLKVLSFDLCAPSALSFINLYTVMMIIPEKIKFMAQVNIKSFVKHLKGLVNLNWVLFLVFMRTFLIDRFAIPELCPIQNIGSCNCTVFLHNGNANMEQENGNNIWL